MSTWELIERRLLREASAVEKLERYVTLRYGQDMADQFHDALQHAPPGRLTKSVATKFSDPKLDTLLLSAIEELGGPVKTSVKRDPDLGRFQKIEPFIQTKGIDPNKTGRIMGPHRFPGERPGKMAYRTTDAVTKALARLRWNKKADPGQFMMWLRKAGEDVSKREADDILYYYSRPEGGEILAAQDTPKGTVYHYQGPAKGPPTAPREPEPSSGVPEPVGDEPTVRTAQEPSAAVPEPGEEPSAEEPAPQRPSGFQAPAAIRYVKPSQHAAQVGALRAKEKESGVRDAQRRVWAALQTYGKEVAQKMADKLGVPVPETVKVKLPNGKTVDRPKVLTADQIEKLGRYRPPGTLPRGGIDIPGMPGTYVKVPERPATKMVQGREIPASRIQGQGLVKPPYKGTFVGQVWRPNGVSREVKSWFANVATGNWQRINRDTNPGIEGNEVVWDGNDWVPGKSWVHRALDRQISPRSGRGQTADIWQRFLTWWPNLRRHGQEGLPVQADPPEKRGVVPGLKVPIPGRPGWDPNVLAVPQAPADERDTERTAAPEPEERPLFGRGRIRDPREA